jgi:hypothetical protein
MLASLKKHFALKKKLLLELHIFFYLELRKALKLYDFIKQHRVLILLRQLRGRVERYKEVRYLLEQRINIWLR